MQSTAFETLFKLEESYWWFVGQRFITDTWLKKYYRFNSPIKILDAGCGTGINLKLFSKYGSAEGIDISPEAVNFCRKRGLTIKLGDIMNLSYTDNSFDVVAALGVIYHQAVTDDRKALSELYRVLKPGGRAYLLDPAMNCLWGRHDEFFNAGRRYNKQELKRKLRRTGFKIEFISYISVFVFPLVYLKRKLEKLWPGRPKPEVNEINPWLNELLKKVYLFELKLLRYFDPPFGVNIYTVVRK